MPLLAASVVRFSVAVLWVISPPFLILLALRQWHLARKQYSSRWQAAWPAVIGTALLADWILFVVAVATGLIGGFGTHYVTSPRVAVFAVSSFLLIVGSLAASVGRGKLCLASVLVWALWIGSLIVA